MTIFLFAFFFSTNLIDTYETVPILIAFLILIERTTPPRGGFLIPMFPHEEPCVTGPPSKDV